MLTVALSFVLAQDFNLNVRRQFVDVIDAFVQERFLDLSATEKGEFGVSRIESNMIDAHFKRTNPPVKKDGLGAGVAIYGAKGKALKPENLQHRFSRWGHDSAVPPERLRKLMVDLKQISATVSEFAKDPKMERKEFARNPYYAQIRPVRLSKRECLSCHQGMKLGEPVALVVYTILPMAESEKPPRGKMAEDAASRARRLANRR